MTGVSTPHISVDGPRFGLYAPGLSYLFHVNSEGDLEHDHFGAPTPRSAVPPGNSDTWMRAPNRREFPDAGRGDMRLPAIHIQHNAGHTVSQFVYQGYQIIKGKPSLDGLPATFGSQDQATTLQVFLKDNHAQVEAILSYSVFHNVGAIARSFQIRNHGSGPITILRAAPVGIDFPSRNYEMLHVHGNWGREQQLVRRKVEHGIQGFQSLAGYSSPFYNPFFALVTPTVTETTGEVWAFNLVYSGSFSAEVERSQRGYTRAILGLNPMHLSWTVPPGETFTTPEVVSVYSSTGLGGMTRTYHRLYREHLSRSPHTLQTRKVLTNNWEATYFDMDAERLYPIAKASADLGVKLFVMDDGWFGVKHPRVNDAAGLGDWVPNPDRFKHGLDHFVNSITALPVANTNGEKLKFGIWVEPEMVNPVSELYEAHPDWVLHAADYDRTTGRNQLVLNLGLVEVQDYIIGAIDKLLRSADISYVKWDNNRSMHELSHPSDAHRYMLGLYRVIDKLTTLHPDVLWEGCASGGGRFDAGLLHYWPQHWTSDNTDGHDRLFIQWGTTLVYPASAMGCHVSTVPNHQSHRTTPLSFRAHVAMMGGSFGFELDISKMTDEEKRQVPQLIWLSERVNPLVIKGDMYRLSSPWESNWPSVQFLSEDGRDGVLFVFQIRDGLLRDEMPPIRLQGLSSDAEYDVDGQKYSGAELQNVGLKFGLWGDYQSKVVFIRRQD